MMKGDSGRGGGKPAPSLLVPLIVLLVVLEIETEHFRCETRPKARIWPLTQTPEQAQRLTRSFRRPARGRSNYPDPAAVRPTTLPGRTRGRDHRSSASPPPWRDRPRFAPTSRSPGGQPPPPGTGRAVERWTSVRSYSWQSVSSARRQSSWSFGRFHRCHYRG